MSKQPIDDGGPAFPGEQGHTPEGGWNQTWTAGMSLRDFFAAAALQGFTANSLLKNDSSGEEIAQTCYDLADAMLAERKREVTP